MHYIRDVASKKELHMDQLKLLNFHKMIAYFANNLVGAFVSLIIFQSTGKLSLAIAYLVICHLIRLIFTLALKNLYGKYPQLLLLLRVIPITLYNIFIFILDHNIVVGSIGICIFVAMDNALNGLSKEIIFNYSSLTQKSEEKSSIGNTRIFEQIGKIVALLVGGYLLDINKTLVVILSIVIYAISVIPLVMFYIRSRKQKTFNKDATSNALTTFSKKDELKMESLRLTKKMLFTYFFVYFAFAFVDILTTSFSLYIFAQNGQFTTAGVLTAVFDSFYAIGFYVAGAVNGKKDITIFVSIASGIIAVCAILLPFVDVNNMFIVICILYGIIAFLYPFLSLFVLDRMLLKSRIMGCSNRALYMREMGCVTCYAVGYAMGFVGLLAIFIAIGVMMLSSSAIIPICEEKTRKHLVDYLQNNEKINRAKEQKRKKRLAKATASQK